MTSLLRFWAAHGQELAVMLGEHVFLVVISTLLAAAIGVPLGSREVISR